MSTTANIPHNSQKHISTTADMAVGSQKHMSTTAAPLFARSEASQHHRDVGKTFLQVPNHCPAMLNTLSF